MSEVLSRFEFSTLSRDTTAAFMANPLDPGFIRRAEQEIHAYIPIVREHFIGFMYHPEGIGPETPYFFPSLTDLNPTIQAASRIGVQAKYWLLVADAINKEFFNPI